MKKATDIGLLLALCACLQYNPAQAITTGPEVGAFIPEFEIRDQNGQMRSFEDLRGPKGLLLLFHRSADW